MGFNKQILDFGRIFGIELFKYKMNKLLIENPPQIHNTIVYQYKQLLIED